MKSIITISLLLVVLISSIATAQFSPQIYPAGTVLKGTSDIFGNVGIYNDFKTVCAGYKYGIGGYADIDVRAGYIDVDLGGDDGFMLSSNLRYQLMEVRIQDPLDLSVGGQLETILGWSDTNIKIGAFAVGSRPIALTDSKDIVPFGRLILRYDKFGDNDDFNIGLNLGANLELNETMSFSGEMQFDDQFGFNLALIYGL